MMMQIKWSSGLSVVQKHNRGTSSLGVYFGRYLVICATEGEEDVKSVIGEHTSIERVVCEWLRNKNKMSLSREATKENCDYIKEHCTTLFGQKFFECRLIRSVQVQSTSQTSMRPNSFLKVEKSFNILALRQLQVLSTPEHGLTIGWEVDRSSRLSTIFIKTADEKDGNDLACELLAAVKHYFPDIKDSLTKLVTQLSPPSLISMFSYLPSSTPDLPCHNFRRSYVAYCDYHDQPFKDEVVYDVERIYFVHDIHEIRLEDFSHLSVKDQVAILGCAQLSSYFTGILVDGLKLTPEHMDILLNVCRRSHALKSLRLLNCGCPTLQSNCDRLPLELLDLSGNHLDEKKGIIQLASALPRLQTLKSLTLSECGLSEKSIHQLALGLYSVYTGLGGMENSINKKFELHTLVLSKNGLKDGEVNELVNFISLCNTLRHLDLSHTGFHVDRLWPALKLGGLLLEKLKLAGCGVSAKKVRDTHQQQLAANVVKELFSSMVNLKELDLAGTIVGAETLQAVLSGLANNNRIHQVKLNLDAVCDRSCIPVLEQYLPLCPVAHLSLRDNCLENEAMKLLPALGTSTSLISLDIGGANFYGLKSNKKYSGNLSRVLAELVTLISSDHKCLEELTLNISNNDIGNFGARLLSKALQLNNSLKKVVLDRNQITADGFTELAHALELNHCVTCLPYPVLDIADALNNKALAGDRPRIVSSIAEIERSLERNRHLTIADLEQQCSQKTVHSLINRSDKYDINSSEHKKVIFHDLTKTVVEMGQSKHTTNPSAINRIVEEIAQKIELIGKEKAEKSVQQFRDALAQKNVEICSKQEEINGCDKTDQEEDDLRKEVKSLLQKHLSASAWNAVFHQADGLLASKSALRLKGVALLNDGPIDTSMHAAMLSRAGTTNAGMHRPNSVFDESLLASMASADLNSIDGLDEPGAMSGRRTPLVHLAKNRPKPARLNRAKFKSSASPSCSLDSADLLQSNSSQIPVNEPAMNNSITSASTDLSSSIIGKQEDQGKSSSEPICVSTTPHHSFLEETKCLPAQCLDNLHRNCLRSQKQNLPLT
uniref:Uncharacterized protein n=1 Tax=Ditylenchus dipsaci TaxID=166011 RepID=A0A915EGM3_9BILA